ncbi:hypothetical protein LN050_01985 [Comamonadaceae bacterium M7527]|nr:hypothetical protein LN050_01985 [Comamonadaceae bacterium M7527]
MAKPAMVAMMSTSTTLLPAPDIKASRDIFKKPFPVNNQQVGVYRSGMKAMGRACKTKTATIAREC